MIKVMLDDGAIMPTKAHEDDAGFDLYTPQGFTIAGNAHYVSYSECRLQLSNMTIDTGVHVAIPKGYVGMVKSKSGLNVKHGLTAEGVIDAGYTGSIVVKLYNHHERPHEFKAGEKIAQLVIMPISTEKLELVYHLEDTERGDNGFGSSGR